MTRLDRILDLFEKYDALAVNHYENISDWWDVLAECRREKEKLTQELIEHGCGGRTDD
jgi:hypothetical protein